MSNRNPVVEARITLLRTDEGGRRDRLPAGTSYRPNHNFFGPDGIDMSVGEIITPADRDVLPGDSFDAIIEFAYWPGLDELISPGREWRIQQGRQLVAIGKIVRVLRAV